MFKIIGGDGREYGPASAETLRDWIKTNRANAQTRVQRVGEAEWMALGSLPEFADAFAAPPLATTSGPAGVAVSPAEREAFTQACLARDYALALGAAWGAGWDAVARRFWLAIGATLLVALAAGFLGAIPVLGALANLLLSQVFFGGLCWFYLRLQRGEPVELGDAFAGFSRAFVPLMLLSLVSALLRGLAAVPAILVILTMAFDWLHPVIGIPLLFVAVLPVIYLTVAWFFAPMIVIDRNLDFWPAMDLSRRMVNKHWFAVAFFLLLTAILVFLGVIALVVGIFVTMAFGASSGVAAYRAIFRPETGGR